MIVDVRSEELKSLSIEQVDHLLIRMLKRHDMTADSEPRRPGTAIQPGGALPVEGSIHRSVVGHLEEHGVVGNISSDILPDFFLGIPS